MKDIDHGRVRLVQETRRLEKRISKIVAKDMLGPLKKLGGVCLGHRHAKSSYCPLLVNTVATTITLCRKRTMKNSGLNKKKECHGISLTKTT